MMLHGVELCQEELFLLVFILVLFLIFFFFFFFFCFFFFSFFLYLLQLKGVSTGAEGRKRRPKVLHNLMAAVQIYNCL